MHAIKDGTKVGIFYFF